MAPKRKGAPSSEEKMEKATDKVQEKGAQGVIADGMFSNDFKWAKVETTLKNSQVALDDIFMK